MTPWPPPVRRLGRRRAAWRGTAMLWSRGDEGGMMIGGIEHPSWCERRECTVDPHSGRGAHASRRMVVGPEPRSGLTMRSRLVQPPGGRAAEEVAFPGGKPTEGVLAAECARALR